MAWDGVSHRVLLFGGHVSGNYLDLNDTWSWNESAWTKLSPPTAPPTRWAGAMAWDPAIQRIVLFGGSHASGDGVVFLHDTWIWDGVTWTKLHPAASPPRMSDASMAYDQASKQLVLFGGIDKSYLPRRETWTFDGSTWTREHPSTAPRARYDAGMAFSPASGGVTLFGGADYGSPTPIGDFGDTWVWTGSNWTKQHPAASPGARHLFAMVDDPAIHSVIVFDGSGPSAYCLDDTWAWTGTTWTELFPLRSPVAQVGPVMIYDRTHGDALLYQGTLCVNTGPSYPNVFLLKP